MGFLRSASLFTLSCLVGFAAVQLEPDTAAADSDAQHCTTFNSVQGLSKDLTVIQKNITFLPANTNISLSSNISSIQTSSLPAFCRIELTIITNTTANSSTKTEIWLPLASAWNGRILSFGLGGLGGGISYVDLANDALQLGFAGISTNGGHDSSIADGSWAGPHNDNAIEDWVRRALHLSAVSGKQIVSKFYKRSIKKSYYSGCSTGGGMGLMAVQTFPEDFDGVVVGSPANWLPHLQAWSIHAWNLTQPTTSSRFIPPAVWQNVIHPEVLNQCDGLDGVSITHSLSSAAAAIDYYLQVVDGIINDPRICIFRPEVLACRAGQNTSTCLNLDQIDAIHRLYTDYYDLNQTYIFGGYFPGGELQFPFGLSTPTLFPISTDYYRFFVFNDTSWTAPQDFNFDAIQLGFDVNIGSAINPDLRPFAGPQHNGKLLQYVGWADPLISPGNSLHYFDTVSSFMQSNSNISVDSFYRLFTVPGMGHCEATAGVASSFGQSGGDPPLVQDTQHSILLAMVDWVEKGVAPDFLVAAALKNVSQPSQGATITRPICPFPQQIRFLGGDPTKASSFNCQKVLV